MAKASGGKTASTVPLIDQGSADAIRQGRHGDPFAVLGVHDVGGRHVLRVMQPGAEQVWALTPDPVALSPLGDGLFAGVLPARAPYRLRAEGHGAQWEWDDPYRYGPVLGEMDEYLLGEGTHRRLWQVLGAHVITHEGADGTHFAVWAPNAERVSVVGDFNVWDGRRHPMRKRGATGDLRPRPGRGDDLQV